MLVTLLVGTALARPPQLSLMAGPAVGTGESTLGTWYSAAPAAAVTMTWNLGPLETWLGASGSMLMAGSGQEIVPSSILQGEVGVGLGGAAFAGGLYVGNGVPGPVVGLYAHATARRHGWLNRVGLETRLFYTEATDSTGLALLLRLEPGRPGARRRPKPSVEGADEGQAVAAPPTEGGEGLAYPVDAPPPEPTGGEALAYPVDAPPPEPTHGGALAYPVDAPPAPSTEEVPLDPPAEAPTEPAGPTHHEDPY